MPGVSRKTDKSTGHGSFPPTPINSGTVSSVRVNGLECATVGSEHLPHSSSGTTHAGAQRKVSGGSGTVRAGGKPVARLGDPIACGDKLGGASGNVFAGG